MPEIVKCKCHSPGLNLFILPLITTNNEQFAAVCPANPPTVYIRENGEWEKKEGWKVESGQVFKADGKLYQLPQTTQTLPIQTSDKPEEEQQDPRPGGRKPAAGTRVNLDKDDYY